MHFRVKRGVAIACRQSVCLSVRPSVTLVDCDHIGWNSSKIISRSVSLGCSLFAIQTSRVCYKGNTLKFSPEIGVRCWKSDLRRTKALLSIKRGKILFVISSNKFFLPFPLFLLRFGFRFFRFPFFRFLFSVFPFFPTPYLTYHPVWLVCLCHLQLVEVGGRRAVQQCIGVVQLRWDNTAASSVGRGRMLLSARESSVTSSNFTDCSRSQDITKRP